VNLAKINNLLVALIILVNAYIIIAPFWPEVVFYWQNHQGKQQQLQRDIQSLKTSKSGSTSLASQPNQVIVPSMLLDQPILEGPTINRYAVLNRGIWRWPLASTPDKGGNTVLIGHRFTYTNPRGVFYFLNKIQSGNEIGVIWNHKKYRYKVVSITQVPPTDTTIQNNTANPELTLFTCAPLLLPKDRLVIVADLETKS
jgi:LPXTG-site transpeptidase (sortase) family protein